MQTAPMQPIILVCVGSRFDHITLLRADQLFYGFIGCFGPITLKSLSQAILPTGCVPQSSDPR
jgi:hypothetical protein